MRRLVATARRQKTAELRREKFLHVVALLRAAMRHGQGQAWMYQALALALDAAGIPPEEIDGALREAAEQTPEDPNVLMHVAALASQLNRYETAVALYQEASLLDPARPEPYVNVMHLAVPFNDASRLQWAVEGVWAHCAEDAVLCRRARRLGIAMEQRLRARGKEQQADGLRDALAAADRVDLVVRLSWLGEADLDLVVEEPGGSVCWWQRAHTESGGMHLGDGFGERKSETYVCREGYSGQYQVKVRRVWGEPVAKRVTLEIVRHGGSSDETKEKKILNLGADGAVDLVDLAQGRRVAAAAVVAADPGGVLAQQRGQIFRGVGGVASFTSRPFVTGVRPVVGRGAIGFQPIIQQIPTGSFFFAQGIVSADRRYVRLTTTPVFTQLGEVFTFTTNLGAVSGGGGLLGGGLGF